MMRATSSNVRTDNKTGSLRPARLGADREARGGTLSLTPKLVARALEGNEEAFALLYRRNRPKIESAVRTIVRNSADAEDIVKDTFVRAFTRLRSLRDGARFVSWLAQIARNRALEHLRRKHPDRHDLLDEHPMSSVSLEALLNERDRLRRAERFCSTLPAFQQRLVKLMAEGYTDREISARLQRSVASIKLHKHRLRRKLAQGDTRDEMEETYRYRA